MFVACIAREGYRQLHRVESVYQAGQCRAAPVPRRGGNAVYLEQSSG